MLEIHCIFCGDNKEFQHCTEDIQEIAKLLISIEKLKPSQKDMVPSLACRKCLGYRRRSRNRRFKLTYINNQNTKDN